MRNEAISDKILFHTKYYSGNQVKDNEMARACGAYGEDKCIQSFVGTSEGKKPLRRPRNKWEDVS